MITFKPGDVIPGVGVVDKNACDMPWPMDFEGNLYMGCVAVGGGLYDARTGVQLGPVQQEIRRNNASYNYSEAYTPRPVSDLVYRGMVVRVLLTIAMAIEAETSSVPPCTKRWGALTDEARHNYLALAYQRTGLRLEVVPARDIQFFLDLEKGPVPASTGELMLRKASRLKGS